MLVTSPLRSPEFYGEVLTRAGTAIPRSTPGRALGVRWSAARAASIIGRSGSCTAAEYSNVMDRQRLRETSSDPLTCPNDPERLPAESSHRGAISYSWSPSSMDAKAYVSTGGLVGVLSGPHPL